MENYNVVPNIITGKDLDYLSDMFNWNYLAFKNTSDAINNVSDDEIKNMLERGSELFNNNMNMVLSILNGGNNE